ncbi:MAG TPA: IPT/TIG domain-containing protein, partial [Myxococcales bacterium]|nr:IPT/TIG domain-containing protein [Myxococcales bacterium]
MYADGSVGFALDGRDRSAGVVIDPVLVYSTYLGGSGTEFPVGISVDPLGQAYVTGNTQSTDFPTVSAFQGTKRGNQDVFVAKVNDSGNALLYSTYLGGTGDETGRDLAADSTGAVYVAGFTTSTDFPLANALQGTRKGTQDGFVFKLSPTGGALAYSTYLGGSATELVNGIALDAYGNAYLTGATTSIDFPTVNAFQSTFRGGARDGFVAELAADGSALVYSSYLGGGKDEEAREIAVDPSGNAYVVGYTNSNDFPAVNAAQPTQGGTPNTDYDGFFSKVNPAGTALVYSTFLGGSAYDEADDVTVDSTGVPTVAGYTASTNFPLVNPQQVTYGGGTYDGFVARYDVSGKPVQYASFIGGDGLDGVRGVAVEPGGGVFLGGYTSSANFPNNGSPPQAANGGGSDAFVAHFDATGNRDFSTYLGGSGDDFGRGLAVDGSGNAYATGQTSSTNFPVAGPISGQGTYRGGLTDAFLAKVGTTVPQVTAINPATGTTAGGTTVTITGVNFNQGSLVSIGGVFATNVTVLSTTTITATTPAHAAGVVDVTVTRRIGTGGAATLTGGFTYTATTPPPAPAPTITRITPPSGTSGGGTAFTITGTNFQPGATIDIGGTAATAISFVSPTTLTGVTPAHTTPATVDVKVTNPDNQSVTLSASYTYVGPPSVTGVTPNVAPITGGTSVAITGINLSTGVAIIIGGLPLQNLSVSSSTRVTGVAPAHPAGTVDIVGINPDGQRGALMAAFQYVGPPTVTSISPVHGPSAGGTHIVITGAGFLSGATVVIDGVAATAVGVTSNTQIDATAFQHAPAGGLDVVVTNPDGQSGTLARGYTYDPPPEGYAGWACGCGSGPGAFALLAVLGVMTLRRRRRATRGSALVVAALVLVAAPSLARAGAPPPLTPVEPSTTKPAAPGTTATAPAGTSAPKQPAATAATTSTAPAPSSAGAPASASTSPAPTSPASSAAPSSASTSPPAPPAPKKPAPAEPPRDEPTT